MIYLVLKDLMLQKKMLWMMVVYVALFSFAFRHLGEHQPIAIIVALGYMLVTYSGAWEGQSKADRLWNSLPIPRWKIVGAKYLSIVVYVAMVSLFAWIILGSLALVTPGEIPAVNLGSAVVGSIVVLCISSFWLPTFFAFGYTKSRYWNFGMFFVFMGLLTTLPTLFAERPAWDVFLEIANDALGLVIALITVALLVGASFFLSVRFYMRREF